MRFFKEFIEEYNKKKTAKKHGRSYMQQEYRNNLAKNLKDIRQFGDMGKDLANILLDKEKGKMGYVSSLGENRESSKDPTKESIENIATNSKKFEGPNQQTVAEMLIKKGYINIFTENIDKFEGLNYKRLAKILIEKGEYGRKKLVECLNKFEGIDYNQIAERLIQAGDSRLIIEHFEKFQGLDNEIIKKCIKANFEYDDKYKAFEDLLKRINGKLDYCIAEALIKNGMHRIVHDYLEKFNELDYKSFIELLVRNGNIKFLSQYIKNFEGKLDYKTAINLINNELPKIVAKNLNKFEGLDKEIAEILIEDGYPEIIFTNLDKFNLNDNDYKEIINKSLKLGMRQEIIHNLTHIEKGLDEKIISELIIQGEISSRTHNRRALQSIIQKNEMKINHTKILEILIKSGYNAIDSYLKEFKCGNKDIAEMLIRENHTENIARNLELFEGLDKEIGEKLIKAGYGDIVARYPKKFKVQKT